MGITCAVPLLDARSQPLDVGEPGNRNERRYDAGIKSAAQAMLTDHNRIAASSPEGANIELLH